MTETGQQLEMTLNEKCQQRTVAGKLHEARERAEDRLARERRVQQLGRNEVSGEAEGADQVGNREQESSGLKKSVRKLNSD